MAVCTPTAVLEVRSIEAVLLPRPEPRALVRRLLSVVSCLLSLAPRALSFRHRRHRHHRRRHRNHRRRLPFHCLLLHRLQRKR